jgi:hypothetical protein
MDYVIKGRRKLRKVNEFNHLGANYARQISQVLISNTPPEFLIHEFM